MRISGTECDREASVSREPNRSGVINTAPKSARSASHMTPPLRRAMNDMSSASGMHPSGNMRAGNTGLMTLKEQSATASAIAHADMGWGAA